MKYRWKADRWCVSELVQGVLRAQVKALDREPWILRLIAPRPEDLHIIRIIHITVACAENACEGRG